MREIEAKINAILNQLSKGYSKALVDKLHSLRIDLKREKEKSINRPKIYGDEIKPLL